ncbi:MAG: DUF3365 domain-containing protein [Verrucomicrobiales bacterium]|nr:DUF3365 domain-containing protein [Verrucomicrobiales bacterium]
MKPKLLLLSLPLALAAFIGWPAADDTPVPAHLAEQVSYERMAGSLHAVLDAAQETCVAQGARAPTNHAAFLRLTGRRIATSGAEFSFALRSSSPINPAALPQTEIEATTLEALAQGTQTAPSFHEETLGGRAYFTAIYPQRATSSACADCHNDQPASPRHDIREGDLMGALVIRIPREF